jgi:hypothetical protein
MFMQVGVQDGGRDPDWDPVLNRWKGFDNKGQKSEKPQENQEK